MVDPICKKRVNTLILCLQNGGDKNQVIETAKAFLSIKDNCCFCEINLGCTAKSDLENLSQGYIKGYVNLL